MRASRPDPAPPPSSDAEWAGMTPAAAAAAAHFEAYDAYDVPSADEGSTARSRGSCAGREASEMQERAQRVSSRLPPHLAARIADAQSRYDCASGAAPSQCNIGCALVYIPFWTEVRLSVFADVVVG